MAFAHLEGTFDREKLRGTKMDAMRAIEKPAYVTNTLRNPGDSRQPASLVDENQLSKAANEMSEEEYKRMYLDELERLEKKSNTYKTNIGATQK